MSFYILLSWYLSYNWFFDAWLFEDDYTLVVLLLLLLWGYSNWMLLGLMLWGRTNWWSSCAFMSFTFLGSWSWKIFAHSEFHGPGSILHGLINNRASINSTTLAIIIFDLHWLIWSLVPILSWSGGSFHFTVLHTNPNSRSLKWS